jgi:hypothetical protein
MCWHLFTWGTAVNIVTPAELRAEMADLALSRCQIEDVTDPLARQAHAATMTSRHVCMADALKARCVLAEVR